MRSYRCDNCGAEILINNDNTFSKCIYCGSSVTLKKKEYNDLNIKKIIRFKNSEEDAINFIIRGRYCPSRNDIIDVKRIFIPVRFCSYDFSYLCSYRYEVSSGDSDSGPTYEDREGLVDGMVYKEAILETNIMRTLLGFHDLRNAPRLDFDPVKLDNISCEFSSSYTEKNILKDINYRTVNFCKRFFTGPKFDKIYVVNHYVNKVDIEKFTTLIPVYLIKTRNGANYAVSGYINDNVDTFADSGELDTLTIIGIIMAFAGFFFPPIMFAGIAIAAVGAANKNKNMNNSKAQRGFDMTDNIRYTVQNEVYTDKDFIYHDFK